MPELTLLDNGELCRATKLTLLPTPDVADTTHQMADEGDDLAIIPWAVIDLSRVPGTEECDIE
jgi:hypothetical protein